MLVVVEVSVGACNHEFKLTTFREGGVCVTLWGQHVTLRHIKGKVTEDL